MLPHLSNPGSEVTIGSEAATATNDGLIIISLSFSLPHQQHQKKGCCPFQQYMPSKPAIYGIKFWVACNTKSSHAWKMQVYTGKSTSGRGPETNQGMRVVLNMTEGSQHHMQQFLHAVQACTLPAGEEHYHGWHGSKEQTQATAQSALLAREGGRSCVLAQHPPGPTWPRKTKTCCS